MLRNILNSSQRQREREREEGGVVCLDTALSQKTLLQTESVQRRGIEHCPKSIYSFNTDTGEQGSDCWNLNTLQLNQKKTKTPPYLDLLSLGSSKYCHCSARYELTINDF